MKQNDSQNFGAPSYNSSKSMNFYEDAYDQNLCNEPATEKVTLSTGLILNIDEHMVNLIWNAESPKDVS